MTRTLPRTKIVATLGPASGDVKTIRRLVDVGVSVFRINFAHGDSATHEAWIARVRKAGKAAKRRVGVLVDLAGPKIRVRGLPGGRLHLIPADTVRIVAPADAEPGTVPIDEPRLLADLRPGDPVFLADGSMELRTSESRDDGVVCEVVTGGLLVEGKGVNVPRTRLRLPSMTPKDRSDLKRALGWDVDAVALSFVRQAKDLDPAKRIIGRRGIPLMAKIEKAEAVEHLDSIVAASDGVMVARGDLGVETPLVEIPTLQKRIIATANAHARPVITATQMLRSMVDSPHPTRAEATDVANAILDGTDAVMLSEETAMGRFPVAAVETMAAIARNAEKYLMPRGHELDGGRVPIAKDALAVSHAVLELAEAVGAVAIVTPTRSGATARHVARLRPRIPILALSEEDATLGALLFTWGVTGERDERRQGLEGIVAAATAVLKKRKLASPGQPFVLTAGFPAGKADSNLLTVQHVPRATRRTRPRAGRRSRR